ncbi:hypothetical protein [Budvicia aquatica]|uniref:Uncharacterized protein n=1 Tax=Budvicia aquatica TaxID=82979 RepID=A0A2C6DJV7_9GAMM|nr:hypothetical protein [Budvicia aquatica]PHI28983.1 hypothetical protein CRN84_06465 [Budvicia aquatica]VFS47117.1 Uncharacterised protein [Budvicia aquatica]
MKKLVILILIPLLQACGDSDTELPYIKAKSAYTCAQYNESRAYGDIGTQNRIKLATMQQLDESYIGSTKIENYYRSNYTNNRKVFASDMNDVISYHLVFEKKLNDTCLNKSDISLSDAMTISINKLYTELSTQPQLATCQSYIDNKISYNDILVEAKKVQEYHILSPVKKIINTPNYGEKIIKENLIKDCETNPQRRLWSLFISIASNLRIEIDKKESEIRTQEREKEKLEYEIKNYATSLFSRDDANCSSYENQYKLSQRSDGNQKLFKEGLNGTIADVALHLKSHQKEVFDKLFSDNPDKIALKILDTCQGIVRDPNSPGYRLTGAYHGPEFNGKSQLVSVLASLPDLPPENPSEAKRGPIRPLVLPERR